MIAVNEVDYNFVDDDMDLTVPKSTSSSQLTPDSVTTTTITTNELPQMASLKHKLGSNESLHPAKKLKVTIKTLSLQKDYYPTHKKKIQKKGSHQKIDHRSILQTAC